jgi:hypothetical protein
VSCSPCLRLTLRTRPRATAPAAAAPHVAGCAPLAPTRKPRDANPSTSHAVTLHPRHPAPALLRCCVAQLSTDLSADLPVKLAWLQACAVQLNPRDARIELHAAGILGQLKSAVEQVGPWLVCCGRAHASVSWVCAQVLVAVFCPRDACAQRHAAGILAQRKSAVEQASPNAHACLFV